MQAPQNGTQTERTTLLSGVSDPEERQKPFEYEMLVAAALPQFGHSGGKCAAPGAPHNDMRCAWGASSEPLSCG